MAAACHGLLVIDKPGGMTSRDVVNRVQRWFPRGTRIGHTGTLDPLATGLLVLCVGTATRLAEYVQRMDKVYVAELRLGVRSDTDDADGKIEPVPVSRTPDRAAIDTCLQQLVGEIEQVPPTYSAAKVTGQRAYQLARRGQGLALPPRRVQVYFINVLHAEYPRLKLEIHCGKGTYIRSLARDLGDRLGCGALVETLRRTRVGPFEIAQALDLDSDVRAAQDSLLPLSAAVSELPALTVTAAALKKLRQGQSIPVAAGELAASSEIAVFDAVGNLAALATLNEDRQTLRPLKVLPESDE